MLILIRPVFLLLMQYLFTQCKYDMDMDIARVFFLALIASSFRERENCKIHGTRLYEGRESSQRMKKRKKWEQIEQEMPESIIIILSCLAGSCVCAPIQICFLFASHFTGVQYDDDDDFALSPLSISLMMMMIEAQIMPNDD